MPKLTFVERWRAEIVVVVVLPISLIIWLTKSLTRFITSPSPSAHNFRVLRVISTVRANKKNKNGKLMRTDRSVYESHSSRNSDKTKVKQVPLRSLRAILGLADYTDPVTGVESRIIHLEPGATVGETTSYLMKQNPPLQLLCCLEMEDATLGGLSMAQGMTTHSHVCGLLSETCVEYEIVTGDAKLLNVTATNEHSRLFRALPMSHGSLGLLTSLKLKVVPAMKYVKLTYTPIFSADDLHSKYTEILEQGVENLEGTPFFVEGIAFSKEKSVLMTGELTNEVNKEEGVKNSIGLWFKSWFYKHCESILAGEKVVVEFVPIRDYLMRHDRSMCMTMGTIIPYGNHPVFRFFLGWLLPPQLSFLKSSHTKETRKAAVTKQCYQDVCFPANKFKEALELSDKLFNIYPLLVYPCQVRNRGGLLRVGKGDDGSVAQINMNLGIYGVPPELENDTFPLFPMVGRVRQLEKWLRENGGFQHTYCDSFMNEAEFEEMFDHSLYNEMRKEYNCDGSFPRVFDKTRPEVNVFEWLKEEEEMNKDTNKDSI